MGHWLGEAIKANSGRILMMGTAIAVTLFGLDRFEQMSEGKYRTTMLYGGTVLLLGYLAPAIKRFVLKKDGVELEMQDLILREQAREAATELTDEVETTGAQIDPDETVMGSRFYAADVALAALLDPPGRHPNINVRIYLMDDDQGGLVPAFGPPTSPGQRPWEPGVGVVGMAFEEGRFVIAVGEDTHNAALHLDEDRQIQHADLDAVAATPMFNSCGTVIGVVAASERSVATDTEPEDPHLASAAGRAELEVTADAAARILIDLAHLFADDV